ncbi:MAG: hypothetical protein SXQ77_01910, partial [Halobacteria archaeon]|nr:hypothetical protein [Halobacteria archaeon]
VAQLEDSSEYAYAWVLQSDATEDDRASLAKEIEDSFIGTQSKEPEALHLIVNNVEEIAELEAETIKRYVKPWLKQASGEGREEDDK